MVERQLPPRYAVRYEDALLSKPAFLRAGDETDEVHLHESVRERESTTLAGARSIQRALQRRGYRVQGIYQRINLHIRPSLDEDTHEYLMLVCGKLDWEWDDERLVDK